MAKRSTVIPDAMRAAAERAGSLEKLRAKLGMSGGLFYGLLRGEPPKKIETLKRLRKGGVDLPDDAIAA